MKKIFVLVLVFGVIAFGNKGFAQEEMQDMGNSQQEQPGMEGREGQAPMGGMRGKGGMNPMMMGMMGGRESMIATSDGGIVVLAGPRLLKYDKDLTLLKEVELPKGKKPAENAEKS